MASSANTQTRQPPKQPVTTYHEKKINGTLYRVNSVHNGKIDLGRTLEDLTVRKILRSENAL